MEVTTPDEDKSPSTPPTPTAGASASAANGQKLAALLATRPRAVLARFCNASEKPRLARNLKRKYNRAVRHSNRNKSNKIREEQRRGFLITTEEELHGLCPIHAAAMCAKKAPAALDVVLTALEKIPPRERDIDIRDSKGLSALAHAVLADSDDSVRKLVKAGADVKAPFCDKMVNEWKRVPGTLASLLSFAVFLNSMNAYRALIQCGAKPSDWDHSGMRPVHVAVLCGNLEAVRDLVAIDTAEGPVDRKKSIELYTVREKFIKNGHGDLMNSRGDDDDDDEDHAPLEHSEPLGDDGPMTIAMEDDQDDDDNESNGPPWGFESSANPSSSRDFYRSLTADLGDFEIDENNQRLSEDGSEQGNFTDPDHPIMRMGDGDMMEDGMEDSDDDDDSLPGLFDMNHDGDQEMVDANEEEDNSEDAKIASELFAMLQGSLKNALAKAERRRKAANAQSSSKNPPSNGTAENENPEEPNMNSQNGAPSGPPTSLGEGQMHILRGDDGTETHIVQMGDVVRVEHMNTNPDGDEEESEGNQLYMQMIAAVFKALNEYQKEFYGANMLHLAARQKQHDVMRYLLEVAPFAQQISDRQNDGLTVLHVAAEVDDPVAIEMLLASGADINVRSDTQNTTPLMLAAKRGLVNAVKTLLEKGARVGATDDDDKTALHYACDTESGGKSSEEIVQLLIEKGAVVNGQSADGSTPVYYSVAHEHFNVFQKLLELGGDPSIPNYDGSVPLGFIATKDMKELASFAEFVAKNPAIKEKMNMDITIGDQGVTALHIACSNGSPAAVKGLLDAGADCNKVNEYGSSPLMTVARAETISSEDRLACLKHLTAAGADVKVAGLEGKQAIHFVTFLGEPECVELLLQHGADPSAVTNHKTPLHLVALENTPEIAEILLKHGAKLNAVDNISMTPLMYAALKHSIEVLAVLIKAGADLTQRAEGGMTALHISAVTADPRAEETVRLLCEAGAPMDIKDEQGMCPIHLHGDFDRTRCVRRLLMCGCDPNLRCEAGFTPLIRACNSRTPMSDNLTLVRVLLRAGADVNAKNDNDNTVMSYLGDTESLHLIRVMLAAGADINVRDKQGDTPLHEASMGNHPKTVALLVKRGADVNARNEEEQTALFIAAQKGLTEVVKALLAKGVNADISIPDKNGVTPYQAAREAGHDTIASMLLDATGLRLSQFAPLKPYDIRSPAVSMDGAADGLRRQDSGRLLCAICQDELKFGDEVRMLPCEHAFHDPCILPWLGGEKMTNNRTCPVCKQLVAPADLFPGPDDPGQPA